jgi:hypothetical protein
MWHSPSLGFPFKRLLLQDFLALAHPLLLSGFVRILREDGHHAKDYKPSRTLARSSILPLRRPRDRELAGTRNRFEWCSRRADVRSGRSLLVERRRQFADRLRSEVPEARRRQLDAGPRDVVRLEQRRMPRLHRRPHERHHLRSADEPSRPGGREERHLHHVEQRDARREHPEDRERLFDTTSPRAARLPATSSTTARARRSMRRMASSTTSPSMPRT